MISARLILSCKSCLGDLLKECNQWIFNKILLICMCLFNRYNILGNKVWKWNLSFLKIALFFNSDSNFMFQSCLLRTYFTKLLSLYHSFMLRCEHSCGNVAWFTECPRGQAQTTSHFMDFFLLWGNKYFKENNIQWSHTRDGRVWSFVINPTVALLPRGEKV